MTRNDSRLRVLVVEDELLIRWAIRETLTDAGHSVVEAENAESAVRALANSVEPIDVVVLDYRLPDSSDLALLAAIRRLSPRTAVVLMTAYGTADVSRRALDLGAFRVMHKPFDLRDLEQRLLEAVGSPASGT
jgi:DNA-binding NtrC family response regulator